MLTSDPGGSKKPSKIPKIYGKKIFFQKCFKTFLNHFWDTFETLLGENNFFTMQLGPKKKLRKFSGQKFFSSKKLIFNRKQPPKDTRSLRNLRPAAWY
ncbi:hypothetical protein DSB62_25930 [Escherichia coli]|nr:hypothetical protein DSB62_25930 [Escherichia coli]